jgi:hypothetical protein
MPVDKLDQVGGRCGSFGPFPADIERIFDTVGTRDLLLLPEGRVVTNEAEARAFFTKFVAAQNAHNADDVEFAAHALVFARRRNQRVRCGRRPFQGILRGTWHLDPDMLQFRASVITDDVMQILVPTVFTRGLRGKPSQDKTFLICQTFVRDANGWHVASILPIANTELK